MNGTDARATRMTGTPLIAEARNKFNPYRRRQTADHQIERHDNPEVHGIDPELGDHRKRIGTVSSMIGMGSMNMPSTRSR